VLLVLTHRAHVDRAPRDRLTASRAA
jgi:hypothetical protein